MDKKFEQEFQAKFINDYSKYTKARKVGIAKRILMQVRSKDRAKFRMAKYSKLYAEMKENIDEAKDIEKDLQTKKLTAEQRERLIDLRDENIDAAKENDEKMAKTIVNAMKDEGYFSRARIANFAISSRLFPRVKEPKDVKKLKVHQKVLARILSKFSFKSRQAEKEYAKDIKGYVMDSIDNLVALDRNDKLIHNPQVLRDMAPKKVMQTIAKQPDIANLEPVTFGPEQNPQPQSTETQTINNEDAAAMLGTFGKKSKEQKQNATNMENLMALVQQMAKGLESLNKEVADLKGKVNGNINSNNSSYHPITGEELENSNSSVNHTAEASVEEFPLEGTTLGSEQNNSFNKYASVLNFDQPGAGIVNQQKGSQHMNQNSRVEDNFSDIMAIFSSNPTSSVNQESTSKGSKK